MNLGGLDFLEPRSRDLPKGLLLAPAVSMDAIKLRVRAGNHSKYNIVGAWLCNNEKCLDYRGVLQCEATLIWNDELDQVHYQDTHKCEFCGHLSQLMQVFVFLEYLSQRACDALYLRLQQPETYIKSRHEPLGEVRVLAARGAQRNSKIR